MNMRRRQQDSTREAILEALGQQIVASGPLGFSMQDVANRAGVTHRTVYNHFPTREALNDAFAVHVEEVIARGQAGRPPEEGALLGDLHGVVEDSYRLFTSHETHMRAYVMLMMASRAPAKVASDRTARFAKLVEAEAGPRARGRGHMIAAAIRMFISSTGFHVLTEHLRLSTAEATAVGTWAVRVLVAAVKSGDVPKVGGDR
jgi:AcrR family transcriptional regulator